MRQADEFPFTLNLFQAPEKESPYSPRLFDLPENRLDRLFSFGVDLLPHFCLESAQRSVNERGAVGNAPAGVQDLVRRCASSSPEGQTAP